MTTQHVTQAYASALAKSLQMRSEALRGVSHDVVKGSLRELFVDEALSRLLTDQFGTGTGVIVNSEGAQSRQTDIIIFDRRILPPLLRGSGLDLYPVEAVVATVEIASYLDCRKVSSANTAAARVRQLDPNGLYPTLKCVFGFDGPKRGKLADVIEGAKFLDENADSLEAVCLLARYCWFKMGQPQGWRYRDHDPSTFEETKRFLAILVDNIRTLAENRMNLSLATHRDWIGSYIRDQG